MKYYSQVGQDEFVLKILNYPKSGYFIDIGCHKPEFINNTKTMEDLGWHGLAFDLIEYEDFSKKRKCKFIHGDCQHHDYNKIFSEENVPYIVDYLSLDIDEASLSVLKKLPLDKYRFKVITIEHDYYIYGDFIRNEQRQILKGKNYKLLCSDVANYDSNNQPVYFEDWWIDSQFIDIDKIKLIECDKMLYDIVLNRF